jgi:cysteine sulfinate desulfinase/cysteine desulfurase-like protein
MSAVTFDTLKFVRHLRSAGVPESQAEAFAEAMKEAQGEADLATKADLREMENRLKAEIQAMLNRHLLVIISAMVGLTAIFSGVLLIALRLVK